jgi:hypothetical protein
MLQLRECRKCKARKWINITDERSRVICTYCSTPMVNVTPDPYERDQRAARGARA